MKSFKFNKILSIILCFVMIVSLFACGDNVETTAEVKETTSESHETVESESSSKTTTAEETVAEKETFTDANGETNAETDTTIGTTEAVSDSESVTESLAESAGVTFTEEITETEQGCDTVAPEKVETTTESETETQSEEEITTEESATDETDEMDRFELFIGDGYADIITPTGLPYRATGYKSIEAEGFIFVSGLNFDFGKSFEPAFNRFTVSYYSSAPVKITLSYTIDGAEIEDCFYLEEGKQSFSGLIIDFLDGKHAASLTTIRVDTCEQKLAEEFLIFDLYTELIEVPERDYYISGSRYTLGIDLGWGGTINYVSDNKCNIDGVENMINKHDPGRLVQQSYYGTGAIEGVFEWGSFNGSNQWPYNPVQGGGKGGYASRIIDFVVEDNYVYVKAQPLDWGKINYITPSYMENWYIIEDDYIKVDNRFVDFSGWEHPVRGQELPAFYTISYLDSFVWYDGVDPWTGDELTWRHELHFWGDSQYSGECSFRIKEPNSETWCAWVSTEDNYGIGLYSPNIDRYSAGRYQYDEKLGVSTGTRGSKDPSDNPTNYVAPWKQVQFVSFEPLEYSYLIAAGSVDEIRAIFTENKDLFDNASLNENSVSARQPYYEEKMESIDFTVEGNEKFAVYPNASTISYDNAEGALKLTVTGSDAHVTIDYLASRNFVLEAKDYKYIEIVYKIPRTNANAAYSCQLFICTGDRGSAAESASITSNLISDGNYHTLRVRVDDKDYWTGRVNLIRFDYFNGAANGDVLFVKSVKLSSGAGISMEKIDFSAADSVSLVTKTSRSSVVYDEERAATVFTVLGADPYFVLDYSFNETPMQAENYTKLRITYMVPAGQSRSNYSYALFPCSGDYTSPSGTVQIYSSTGIIADGEYHTLEIDLSSYDFWGGEIHKIRFDYFNEAAEGDVFYITSFELVK